LSVFVADKGYDSEDNHVLVREELYHAFSMIPVRYEYVPIWRTYGKYIQKRDETWLFQIVVQSMEQGRNHNVSYKTSL
jgi:hypothetical protein